MKSVISSLRRAPVLVAGLLLGLTASSRAAVVTWDIADVTTPSGTNYDESGIWFNFFTGSTTVKTSGSGYLSFALGQFQINFNATNGLLNLTNQTPFTTAGQWVTYGNGPARLVADDFVDGGSSYVANTATIFGSSSTSFYNSFDDLGTGYIGVKFTDASVNTYYGYMEITVNPDYTTTLKSFSYESVAGDGIAIPSAIPEPSAYAALAGAALLTFAAVRRRR